MSKSGNLSPAASPVHDPLNSLELEMLKVEENKKRDLVIYIEEITLYSLFFPLSRKKSCEIIFDEKESRNELISLESFFFYGLMFAERFSDIKEQKLIIEIDDSQSERYLNDFIKQS